jgi:hypothetical protein
MIENKGKAAFSAKVYLEHVLAKYVSKNANEVTSFLNFIANYGHDVTRDVMQVAAAHKASAVAIPFM